MSATRSLFTPSPPPLVRTAVRAASPTLPEVERRRACRWHSHDRDAVCVRERQRLETIQQQCPVGFDHQRLGAGLHHHLDGPGANGGPQGIIMHDTMAFTVEGLPLGLVDIQVWARAPEHQGKKHKRHSLPIEQKESFKWLRSFQAAARLGSQCRETTVVSVGDREADIYELFALALSRPDHPKLLVRAESDRLVADGQEHLWQSVQSQPVAATQILSVPRNNKGPARTATLEIRFAPVLLRPPQTKKKLGALQLWAVLTNEIDAPEGVEPLQWMLLTTVAVNNPVQALEKLHWYTKRWGIEVYHRTIKSGCRVEERQLRSVERLENSLAIDLVVAWRILHMTMLGREAPELDCSVIFQEHEWKALHCYVHRTRTPPHQPPTLGQVIRQVAKLGGFLGRKGDGDPGTQNLWRGLLRLDAVASSWLAFGPEHPPDTAQATSVSSEPICG